MNIFEEKSLYPNYGKPILKHFSEHFESVFIALIPFFKIKGEIANKFPNDNEILTLGTTVNWSEIVDMSGFKDINSLHIAMQSSIGKLEGKHIKKELEVILENTLKMNKIWAPSEGGFDIFSLEYIYKSLTALHKENIFIEDEFYRYKRELNIDSVDLPSFVRSIKRPNYYIYSTDLEILFSADWDSFFYLICSSRANIELIRKVNPRLEGFYCDNETIHEWSIGR